MEFLSSAEMEAKRRILLTLQDHVRSAVTVAGYLPQMLKALGDSEYETVEKLYKKVKVIDENSRGVEKGFLRELLSVGPLLTSRDELIRLISSVSSIIDSLEGSAYRIAFFSNLRKLPKNILEETDELARKAYETVAALRECIFLLSYNPDGIMEASKKVVASESNADEAYRSLATEILGLDLKAADLLAINDVVTRLEEASDKSLEALDTVNILLM
ncbi:MAG: DUF47 family protein [Candidatus Geothermarchaeales archaeon]